MDNLILLEEEQITCGGYVARKLHIVGYIVAAGDHFIQDHCKWLWSYLALLHLANLAWRGLCFAFETLRWRMVLVIWSQLLGRDDVSVELDCTTLMFGSHLWICYCLKRVRRYALSTMIDKWFDVGSSETSSCHFCSKIDTLSLQSCQFCRKICTLSL